MKIVRFWLPALFWMVLIFIFSSQERLQVSQQQVINFLFFKTLHIIEYGILFILNFRALRNTTALKPLDLFLATFLLTIAYALTDEIHQTLVPTREGKVRDVIIDGVGASLAWYFLALLLPKAPRKLQELAKSWGVV